VRQASPPPRKEYVARSRPAIDPWTTVINKWLIADQDVHRKQRYTARRVWQRLLAEHGTVLSEVSVSRYVTRRRVELDLVHVEVYIPKSHEPGAEAEVDFGEFYGEGLDVRDPSSLNRNLARRSGVAFLVEPCDSARSGYLPRLEGNEMPSQTPEFGTLLEAVPDALVGVDEAGVIRFVNHQTELLFGYHRGDMVGAPLETLVPESLRQLHEAHRQGYEAAPRSRPMGTDVKLSGRRRDGTEFPVDIALSAIDTGDGMLVIAAVRDMTDYRWAEIERRRLAALVEGSDDAIIGSTLERIITSWNPAAERLFGYSGEEIIGKSTDLLTPEDLTGEVQAVLARTKPGLPVQHLETTGVRKDGTVFPVSLTVSPICDEDGAMIGASLICRDVTRQKQAVEASQRAAAIVENSDDAIISFTLDGIVTSWNPAAERMYGYSGEQAMGTSIFGRTPKDQVDEIQSIVAKVSAGQLGEHLETDRVRKDGTQIRVSFTISPIRDDSGSVVGISTIARDMTEQRKAIEIAQRMAAIVESSQDAIISKSLDGSIASWNPAAERLFGYSGEEIIGKPGRLLGPEDRADEIVDILAKIGAGQPVEPLETVRVRKDGTLFPVSLTVSPVRDADGEVIGAAGIFRDVTELKQAAQYARSLIEAGLDPMVTISPEGQITDVNEATVQATGVTRDKLLGTDFSNYFTEPEKAEEIYQRVLAEGMAVDYPLTLLHRDGDEVLTEVLYNASVYRDPNGTVLGVFAAARDVTRQRQAQREIAEQQAREKERLKELEQFQRLTVGRELKMIELKKEIEHLKKYGPASGSDPGAQH
jgi:PAS domain S-box-containing protein